MPRPVATPQAGQPKRFPLRLPDSLADDLYAFCEASSAFHTKVICKAVQRLIEEEVAANPGLRAAFERERQRLVEQRRRQRSSGDLIRLVEPNVKKPGGRPKRRRRPR